MREKDVKILKEMVARAAISEDKSLQGLVDRFGTMLQDDLQAESTAKALKIQLLGEQYAKKHMKYGPWGVPPWAK